MDCPQVFQPIFLGKYEYNSIMSIATTWVYLRKNETTIQLDYHNFNKLNLMYIRQVNLMNIIDYARTGIEAGLFTTTRSSSIWIILIFSFDTGTSCLKNQIELYYYRSRNILAASSGIKMFEQQFSNMIECTKRLILPMNNVGK